MGHQVIGQIRMASHDESAVGPGVPGDRNANVNRRRARLHSGRHELKAWFGAFPAAVSQPKCGCEPREHRGQPARERRALRTRAREGLRILAPRRL